MRERGLDGKKGGEGRHRKRGTRREGEERGGDAINKVQLMFAEDPGFSVVMLGC